MEATCKLGEKGCWNDGKCRATSNCECKVVTNADRIRAMSDEELAEFLADDDRACPPKHCNWRKYIDKCDGCWLEWLQQPAEEVQ